MPDQFYVLCRTKREWVPEWLWWLAAHVDRHRLWIALWLTEDA